MNRLQVKESGVKIESTLETLRGLSGIQDVSLGDDGKFDLEFDGYTKVLWDDQKTATEDGQRLFVGEDKKIYKEDEIEIVVVFKD